MLEQTVRKHGWPIKTKQYRKKPVAVYAAQWNPKARYWPPHVYQYGDGSYVRTANGNVEISVGTWICWQRVNGALDVWPVTESIFARTYEQI